MTLKHIITCLIVGALISSCDPHARHLFGVDNTGSTDVDVVYIVAGMEAQDTLVAAGELVYFHAINTEACIDSLDDETFSEELEFFLVSRGGDTLIIQEPGNMSQWKYAQTDNAGAMLSPCSGEGTFTFLISDSLYPY